MKRFMGLLVLVAGAILASVSPACAYGSEGLFGGRPNPDSEVDFGLVAPAMQDRPDRAESVLSRPRPDYDPKPVMIDSFALYPSVEIGGAYDSNIYASSGVPTGDGIASFRPILSGLSNWGRHSLSFSTYGDIAEFGGHSRESYQDAVLDAQGRYDIANRTWLALQGGVEHLTEPRSSPDDANGNAPETFDVYKAGVSAHRGVGIIGADLNYRFSHFAYTNLSTSSGSVIDETARDRNEQEIQGKATYELSPRLIPYLRLTYDRRDYDTNTQRQSQGYAADIGTSIDFGGITSLELYAGWLAQDYANASSKKEESVPDIGGRLDWNVTGLTSLALEASRSIEETSLTGYNGFLRTGTSVTVTHELLRNVIVEADSSLSRDDYAGTASRHDTNWGAGAGTRWLINRSLYTDLDYNWTRRNPSDATPGYVDNLVSLRLGVRL